MLKGVVNDIMLFFGSIAILCLGPCLVAHVRLVKYMFTNRIHHQVYISSDCSLSYMVLCVVDRRTSRVQALLVVNDEFLKHCIGEVRLVSCSSGTSFEVDVSVFRHARCCKHRIFWSYVSLYKACKLKVCQGQPSHWTAKHWSAWAKQFSDQFGVTQGVHGVQHSFATNHKLRLDEAERCLPYAATSTLGVLSHMLSFGFLTPQQGGLRDVSAKLSAANLLHAMLAGIVANAEALKLRVSCEREWKSVWPRPEWREVELPTYMYCASLLVS